MTDCAKCTATAVCPTCRNRAWRSRWTPEKRAWENARKRRGPSRRYVLDDIDHVAVQLAVGGQRGVPLNLGERRLATRLLTEAGRSATQIADLLGVHVKTVERDRAIIKETAA